MKHLAVPALLLAAGVASAQDMPLHEILKPGETWQLHDGGMPVKASGPKQIDLKDRPLRVHDLGPDGMPSDVRHEFKEPTVGIGVLGGSTYLFADAADRYIWAMRREKDGSLDIGDRYMRLRVRGDDRRKDRTPPDAYRADLAAMTVDAADRTYVATNLGIQVFDPTGRLCGVFTAPPGRVTELVFNGDRLFARVADKVFVRKMLAKGN
jgi:hypothetical protein